MACRQGGKVVSGPKGFRYTVSAEELRRRAVAAARARIAAREATLAELRVAASVHRNLDLSRILAAVRSTTSEDVAELQRAETRLDTAITQVSEAIGHAERRLAAAKVDLVIAGVTLGSVTGVGSASPRVESNPASAPAARHGQRLAKLRERVAEHPEASEASQEAIQHLVTTLSGGSEQVIELAFAIAETSVVDAIKAQAKQDELARARRVVHHAQADLTGTEADTLLARLGTAATLAEITAISVEFASLRARQAVAATHRQVQQAVMESLADLGYAPAQGGSAGQPAMVILRSVQDTRIGVQVTFDKGSSRLLTRPLTFGPQSAAVTQAAEERTCEDIDALLADLSAKGVETTAEFRRQVGTVPVAAHQTGKPATQQTSRVQAPKEREL